MWLQHFPWATTTGRFSGEGSFSKVEVDNGGEGVVCLNSLKGATDLAQRWEFESSDHFQKRGDADSGVEARRTVGLWSKTTA